MSAYPIRTNLGEQVREMRKQRGLSLEKLGDMAGVSWLTIYRWEKREASPVLENAAAILAVLDCELTITPRVR